jgi:hypothetical protein
MRVPRESDPSETRCVRCGARLRPDARFCVACGTPTGGVTEASSPRAVTDTLQRWGVPGFRTGTRWKQVVAVIGYILLALLILGAIVSPSAFSIVFSLVLILWVGLLTDAWGMRRYVPGLRVSDKRVTVVAWTALALASCILIGFTAAQEPERTTSTSGTSSRSASRPEWRNAPEAREPGTASSAAPTPQPVAEPTFVVNSMPIGCHAEPDAGATVVVERSPGTVQVMDQLIRLSGETWHHEAEQGCWTRTDPGPVRIFRTLESAQLYAAAFAPQPVAGPTFAVNTGVVGCHESPSSQAQVVTLLPKWTIQAMDLFMHQPNERWHRDVDRHCWTRTNPGPVRIFSSLAEAERFVTATRPPRVGQPVRLEKDGWVLTVTEVTKQPTVRVLFETKRALGVYVRVVIRMENIGKEAHALGSNRFTLVDDRGRKFQVYVYVPEIGSRINPGLAATGALWFDVPPDATGLMLESLGGFRVELPDVADIPFAPGR